MLFIYDLNGNEANARNTAVCLLAMMFKDNKQYINWIGRHIILQVFPFDNV